MVDLNQFASMTKGPWRVNLQARQNVFAPNNRGICSTGGYADNRVDRENLLLENEANARAIAALPEMIVEIERLRAFVDWCASRCYDKPDSAPADLLEMIKHHPLLVEFVKQGK